jgi:hypothetical protein
MIDRSIPPYTSAQTRGLFLLVLADIATRPGRESGGADEQVIDVLDRLLGRGA